YLEKHDPLRKAQRQQRQILNLSVSLENNKLHQVDTRTQNKQIHLRETFFQDNKINQTNEVVQSKKSLPKEKIVERSTRFKTSPFRQPLSASTKHHVWLRDQGQCRFHQNGQRCENRKYLEVHHKKPVALGGANQPENLMLLCHEHHKTVHMRF
ncbi:MAG: HNH endonuclease, partial [Bdellovibrionales bacterium]|nr:HNH endonuclease [Bdellovibrionales bacterium]